MDPSKELKLDFTDKGSSNGKKEQSSVLVEVKNKDQYISYRNRHF
jgi:hypothetical protein